ncbi:DMT family transporter [Leisingera methylohalidivorans]|uniref:Membrane protein n=1 Tax=Leisingera methylohalidivorans DSM 14336 TaxID=999552 RepID=V9VUV1_9RHOB|nr:DMT family transporter [Leisingera methylohalidivorans]AHD01105.1 membrane protein [Leisingera methylohalidivorans DSM 14336]
MNNLHGIFLVIVSMAFFTLEDMFIKRLSGTVPVGQILLFLGLGSGFVFAAMAKMQGHRLLAARAWRKKPVMRAASEAVSAMGFASALALVDISTVAAVFQATPLVITMGAALFLKEDVGWRRWLAICTGFAGVLLIIRPGLDGFEPAALLVVVAVLGVAARDLMTRTMDAGVPSAVLSFQAFLAVVPAGVLLLIFTPGDAQALAGGEWMMIAGGVLFGVLGYYGIVTAMRVGDASAVTPFRYTRLLFSILAGVIVFGERPDALTLAGAALIIASGLYTFVREQGLARRARRAAAAAA